jgi:hypothetical protein
MQAADFGTRLIKSGAPLKIIERKSARFMAAMLATVIISGCGNGDGGSAVGQLARENTSPPTPAAQVVATATPPPAFAPAPTETPDYADPQPAMQPQPAQSIPTQLPTMQPPQVEMAPTITPLAPTETPDIAGFAMPGIDESTQPCPARFWKRGRCNATPAQIAAYANEVQP